MKSVRIFASGNLNLFTACGPRIIFASGNLNIIHSLWAANYVRAFCVMIMTIELQNALVESLDL